MAFQLETSATHNAVTAIEVGRVQINGIDYAHGVLLSAEQLTPITPPDAAELTEITPECWQAMLAFAPEVLLIGTGARQQFPMPELLAPFFQAQIGVEVMTSAAAARTYNVLMHEGRWVQALILLP